MNNVRLYVDVESRQQRSETNADVEVSSVCERTVYFKAHILYRWCGVPNRNGTALYSRGCSKSRAVF